MDNWGILAWIGERACTRVQRLAPEPSAFKVLLVTGLFSRALKIARETGAVPGS
jgi:hypothetical protein